MNFKDSVNKRYQVLSGHMKELAMEIDEYLGQNEDDADDLQKLAEDREKFLASPYVKKICKDINPKCSPDLLLQKIKVSAQAEDTFKVYEPTQPSSLKSKELKIKEEDLEQGLRNLIGVPKTHGSKLEQPKKGSWVFKAMGKEYSVTKYHGE